MTAAGFGQTLIDVLPDLRTTAESRMLDTVEIQYPTGATTQDPDTGHETPVYATELTTQCRVKSIRINFLDQEVGGRTSVAVTRELHIPWDTDAIRTNARVVVTAIDASTDPTLLGAVLVLGGVAPGSQTTARRIEIVEIVA